MAVISPKRPSNATFRVYEHDFNRIARIRETLELSLGRPQSMTDVVLYLLDRHDKLLRIESGQQPKEF